MMSGIILGLINILITVAVLILVGYIIVWLLSLVGFAVPLQVQKIYAVIVALIALYMLVALLMGMPTWRIIGSSQVAPVISMIAAPIMKGER